MTKLLTRGELAGLLNVSTRTLDRWRSEVLDLGEFRAHHRAVPRFDPAKVRDAIESNGFGRRKKRRPDTESAPIKTDVGHGGVVRGDREERLPAVAS